MQTTKARKFVCLNSAVKSEVCQFACTVNGDIFRFTCLQIISNDVTSSHSANFAVDGERSLLVQRIWKYKENEKFS